MASSSVSSFPSGTIFNESGKVLKRAFDEFKTKFDISSSRGEVSLKDIMEWKKVMYKYQASSEDKILEGSEKQVKAEETVIIERGNCPLSRRISSEEVIVHLNEMKIKKAADLLQFSYLRGEGAPAALSCIVGAVGEEGKDSILSVGRIRNYFKDPTVISKGANGAVIIFKFQNKDSSDVEGGGKSLFLLKAPLNPTSNAQRDGTHEAFVGFFALNQLRNIIPNFMYTYSAFRCTPPVLPYSVEDATSSPRAAKGTKLIDAWCSLNNPTHTNNVTYTVIENLADTRTGKTTSLKKFIMSGGKVEEFVWMLAQIVAALGVAWETCKFTHYDLHDENVLVRETGHGRDSNSEVLLNYDLRGEGKSFNIRAAGIATIIDYGMSHVQIGDVHFGHASDVLMNYGVLRDRGNSFFDVFKVIGFSISSFETRLTGGGRLNDKDREILYSLLFPFVKGASEDEKFKAVEEIIQEGAKYGTSFYYDTIFFNEPPSFSFSGYLEYLDGICLKSGMCSPIVSEYAGSSTSSSSSIIPFNIRDFDIDFEKVKETLISSKTLAARSARTRGSAQTKIKVDDYAVLLDIYENSTVKYHQEVVFDEGDAFEKLKTRISRIKTKINSHIKDILKVGKGKYVSVIPSSTRKTVLDTTVFSLANILIIYDYAIQATNLLRIYRKVYEKGGGIGLGIILKKTLEEVDQEIAEWTKQIEEIEDYKEKIVKGVSNDLKTIGRVSIVAKFGGKRKFEETLEYYPLFSYGYDLLKDLNAF